MTRQAVLALVSPASRLEVRWGLMGGETAGGVKGLLARASVLMWIVAGEAGETSAALKAAAGHEADRLEAHGDRLDLFRLWRDLSGFRKPVAAAAHLNLSLG